MQEEGTRNSLLSELGGSIDLDEVLARTLDAAGALPGADAALVSIRRRRQADRRHEGPLRREASARRSPGRPTGTRRARSRSPTSTRRAARRGARALRPGRARSAASTGSLGFLAIYSRAPTLALRREHDPGARGARPARAGPAIDNARRFREARQLADLDALTGLHNRRYFHETLAREVRARAPLRPPPGAARLRPRRLQGDQRPHRPPRRRRRARRDRRAGARRRFARPTSRAASAATSSR